MLGYLVKILFYFLIKADNDTVHLLWMLLKDSVYIERNLLTLPNYSLFLDKDVFGNGLSLKFEKFNDVVVCFYHGISSNVYNRKIDKYLYENFPNSSKITLKKFIYKFKEK